MNHPLVDVLAIAAHPDDMELGCAGTLLKLREQGYKTGALDLTRGELGSRGTPEIRAREAEVASRILGLEFRANLELPDGNVPVDAQSRLRVIRILRCCRPRLVITHSRVGHPDHWHTAQMVEEAVHHAGLTRIETGQQRFRPEKIAYWLQYTQSEPPQVVVDISEHYERKEEAVKAYASQLHQSESSDPETYLSRPDFLDQIKAQNRHYGNLGGCAFAEGFFLSRLPRLEDLTLC